MVVYTEDHADARKSEKNRKGKIRYKEIAKKEAVNRLAATREGRIYLRWLLEISRALLWNPYRADPNLTGFACGEQSVGQRIALHMIEAAPAAFMEILKEEVDERHANSNRDDTQFDLFGGDDAEHSAAGGSAADLYN